MKAQLFWLLLFSAPLYADIFAFKDLEGYEKCLRTDHLAERKDTNSGAQSQFLGAAEVQLRCVEAAGKLVAKQKNKKLALDFIKATKRGTGPENAIEFVGPLAQLDAKACNDTEVYEVVNRALSRPKEVSSTSVFQKAKRAAKLCLKDKQYRADFTEEKDASNSYLKENACEILVEEKIVKSCPKG